MSKLLPTRGPRTAERPNVAPPNPMYMGRLAKGTASTIRTMEPEKIAATLSPWIARPTIILTEFCAPPQTTGLLQLVG